MAWTWSEAASRISLAVRLAEKFQLVKQETRFQLDPNNLFLGNQSTCSFELQRLGDDFVQRKLWALKTIDAWGKVPSGILEGNIHWIGSIYECNHGLTLINKTTIETPFPMHSCMINYNYTKGIRPVYCICLPRSCQQDDIVDFINQGSIPIPTADVSINISNDDVHCIDRRNYDIAGILAITILSLIGFIVISATFIHLVQDYKKIVNKSEMNPTNYAPIVSRTVTTGNVAVLEADDEPPIISSLNQDVADENNDDVALISPNNPTTFRSVMRSFAHKCSLINNFFILNHDQEPKELACLNGIRVISLFWVILGHTVLFAAAYSDNPIRLLDWSRELWFQTIIQAVFSIDSFFLLSGLLTAFTFFIAKNDNEQFSMIKFLFNHYVYRYLRYTIFYALMLLIYVGLSPYLNDDGPVYPIDGSETKSCRRTWWRNLLYINNFFESDEGCMPITWFLAVNMQFHWIAPLFLLAVLWKWIGGLIVAFSFIIVDIISTSVIVSKNGYDTVPLFSVDSNHTQGYMNDVYIKPWCRIGPYAIGLLLGHYLYDLYQRKNGMSWESLLPDRTNVRFYRLRQIFMCLASTILLNLCLLGTYQDYAGNPLTKSARAAFLALSRIGWATGVSLIIISCFIGYGGLINQFLSHRLFNILGHVTYGAYLWHSLVIFVNYLARETPQHYTLANLMFNCVIHILLSYLLSFLTFLFVEFPIIRLLKLIFKRSINQN